jgi:hypothetical protein
VSNFQDDYTIKHQIKGVELGGACIIREQNEKNIKHFVQETCRNEIALKIKAYIGELYSFLLFILESGTRVLKVELRDNGE